MLVNEAAGAAPRSGGVSPVPWLPAPAAPSRDPRTDAGARGTPVRSTDVACLDECARSARRNRRSQFSSGIPCGMDVYPSPSVGGRVGSCRCCPRTIVHGHLRRALGDRPRLLGTWCNATRVPANVTLTGVRGRCADACRLRARRRRARHREVDAGAARVRWALLGLRGAATRVAVDCARR